MRGWTPVVDEVTLCSLMKQELVEQQLDALGAAVPLTVLAETTSTNDEARAAAEAGAAHGAAFLADAQRRGRGRGDHRWHSPPGRNVYLSVVLRPSLDPAAMAPLTLAVGAAVAAVVDAHLAAPRAMLKWPNDVLVDGRKIAGVLLEAITRGSAPPLVIAGVGLNVLGRDFPPELAARAISLELAGGAALARERIAAELVAAILAACAGFERAGLAAVAPELARRDALAGRRVRIGELEGEAAGIDEHGRLRVLGRDGRVHALWSGEVDWAAG